MAHIIVIEFAKRFGVKEGLLLTELCRRTYSTGTEVIPFSISQGRKFFPYLTAKQIRLSLENLLRAGGIRPALETRKSLDRTRSYQVDEKAFQYYLKIVLAQQFFLNEGLQNFEGGV